MPTPYEAQNLFKTNRLSDFLPYRSYEPEQRIYLLNDNSFGIAFEMPPITAVGNQLLTGIISLLEQDFPEKTLIQQILYADPNMERVIDRYTMMRAACLQLNDPRDQFLWQWTDWQSRFLMEHRKNGISADVPVPFRNFRCFLTIKVIAPFGSTISSSEKTVVKLNLLRDTVLGIFRSNHIPVFNLSPDVLNQMLWQCWNPGHDFIDRRIAWDEYTFLNQQIIAPDTEIIQQKNSVIIDNHIVKVKIPQIYPKEINTYTANMLLGSPFGMNQSQICCPFLLTLNIDPSEVSKSINTKAEVTSVQNTAFKSMAPALRRKNEEFSWAVNLQEQGGKFIRGYYTLVLFSSLDAESDKKPENRNQSIMHHEGLAKAWWESHNFRLQDEIFCTLPYMMAAMPFGLIHAATKEMNRYITAPADTIAQMFPLQADWRGTSNEVMLFLTRRGQICSLDFFQSDSNYNFAVAAPSGSGKSFLVNKILQEHSSRHGICYVIDVGKSYRKQCELQMGQYIEFDNSKNLSVNVFGELSRELFAQALIEDIDDEVSNSSSKTRREDEGRRNSLLILFTQILAVMANPKEPITDLETSVLSNVIQEAYSRLEPGKLMEVDNFVYILDERQNKNDEQGVQDHIYGHLAERLRKYCAGHEYGKWFRGKMNIDFQKPFVVLELEELNSMIDLREVILLLIISIIERTFFLGNRKIPKIVLFDEAWDLFRNPNTANFIETAYRRMRKYNGSIGTIVQSFLDFDSRGNAQVGQAILSNSEWKIALAPKVEELKNCNEKHILSVSDWDLRQAESIHTDKGVYSEILLLASKTSAVFRFVPTPAEKVAFTTSPQEVQVYENLREGLKRRGIEPEPLIVLGLSNYAYEQMKKGISSSDAEILALNNMDDALKYSFAQFNQISNEE